MASNTLVKQFIESRKENTPISVSELSYFEQLDARIEHCRRGDRSPSNCIGTGLFLVGLQKYDVHTRIYEVHQLSQLQKSNVPQLGGLVSWEEDVCGRHDVNHLAVVTHIDPVLLTHREGSWGRFLENEPLEEVVKKYKTNLRITIVFYAPNTSGSIPSQARQPSIKEKKELEEGRACKDFLEELSNTPLKDLISRS